MQKIGRIKLRSVIILSLLGGIVSQALATTLDTPESAAIERLGRMMKMYGIMNQGALPTSWQQISTFFDLDRANASVRERQSYPLQDHYQFITQPLPLIADDEGRVLVIRTIPLADRKQEPDKPLRLKRYMIYEQKGGEIITIGIDEKKVQAMLKKAGVTITPKAGLPAMEYDTLPLDYVPPAEGTTKSRAASSQETSGSISPPTAPVKQPKTSAPAKTRSTPIEKNDQSWLVWLAVVIVATGGVVWLFIRKSSK